MQGMEAVLSELSNSFDFTVTENQKKSFKNDIHDQNLHNLISNLEARFSDAGVLSALATIFSPQKAMSCHSAGLNIMVGHQPKTVHLLWMAAQ